MLKLVPAKGSRARVAGGLVCWLVLGYFSVLMARITLGYWPLRSDAGFLQIKQQYLGISHWEVAFWVHVAVSMLALLAGFTQFAPRVLGRWPALHRGVGRMYVVVVCVVSGPASLIMGLYANGGVTSRIAFCILAVLWIATTARGWQCALVFAFEPRPMDLYRLVAWLGFVPNLLVAEWLIRRHRRNKAANKTT
jgi:hypothetical protein